MKMNRFAKAAVAVAGTALVIGTATAAASAADDMKAKKEKCYGVAAKGMNDCASANHSCAGQSTQDAHPEEWVYVPAGLCDRLAGGVSESKKKGG
ncbi:DUF2282 domain-containing protein [Kordiimonas marina]|uniref:BufA1 family periplasmic bufferin-type metallophore n=1 Tax=Kordiimonas marina TaxID=2872312 RepID=UPI001FF4375F|nr:DUF2282 domain-containing protein [Kordiimonas marina]